MCKLCDEGKPQDHTGSATRFTARFPEGLNGDRNRRGGSEFLKRACRRGAGQRMTRPSDSGKPGRRYIIRGGSVMSMDPSMP